jgi:GT2 family glycosyltransferase
MVNHMMRRREREAKGIVWSEEPRVKVRNKTGLEQWHGRFHLPADTNAWAPLPKSLAARLAQEPENYEVWSSKKSPPDEATRRGWKFRPEDVKFKPISQWPSVSIVIPVFNSPALLRECLTSLRHTDYPGEVGHILVDNASTDLATLKLIHQSGTTSIRFDKPVGFATAVNAGMKKTKADYYVLFNQDCRVVEADWLANLVRWMEHRPQCAIAGPKLVYPDGTIQAAGTTIPKGTIGAHRYVHSSPEHESVNLYEKVQAVTGAAFAIRRSAIKDGLGYLDEEFKFSCEDTAYCVRATCLGFEVWYVPESVVVHHESAIRRATPNTGHLWICVPKDRSVSLSGIGI